MSCVFWSGEEGLMSAYVTWFVVIPSSCESMGCPTAWLWTPHYAQRYRPHGDDYSPFFFHFCWYSSHVYTFVHTIFYYYIQSFNFFLSQSNLQCIFLLLYFSYIPCYFFILFLQLKPSGYVLTYQHGIYDLCSIFREL